MICHKVTRLLLNLIAILSLLILMLTSIMACSRCHRLRLLSDTTLNATSELIEKNAVLILERTSPPEAPLLKSVFGTNMKCIPDANNMMWCCKIKLFYVGGGGLVVWGTKDREEREISVKVKGIDSKTAINIEERISKNVIVFATGHLFADELVPILYEKHAGIIEIRYENGGLYSKGMLVNGKREGEWNWWWSNGELMQSVKYVDGKYDGVRLIRKKHGNAYEEYRYRYVNGKIVWDHK